MPQTDVELILLIHQRNIKAHYCYSNLIGHKAERSHYPSIIPIKLRNVRPKDMDKPHMKLGICWILRDNTYTGEQAQEKAMFIAIKERSSANMDSVETAIEMIKGFSISWDVLSANYGISFFSNGHQFVNQKY